jgi:hypothetical protein
MEDHDPRNPTSPEGGTPMITTPDRTMASIGDAAFACGLGRAPMT